jgi:flagellar FliL protein
MAKAKIEKDAPEQESSEMVGNNKAGIGTLLVAAALGALLMLAAAGVTVFVLRGELAAMLQPQGQGAGEAAAADTAAIEETAEEDAGTFLGTVFEMEPLIVNLERSQGKRYLKVKMSFELNKGSVVQEMEARMPQIRDAILLMISSKAFVDISTVEGKLALRDALVTRINGLLETGFVKRIYFQEFVVQ